MATFKDFLSGGLPALLDQPEPQTTGYDNTSSPTAGPTSPANAERFEPAAPGAGSAYVFGMNPGTGFLVIGGGLAIIGILGAVAISAFRR